jgi:hypothetical protein
VKVVDKHKDVLELTSPDGDRLVVSYDNRGEPFREGITLEFGAPHWAGHRTIVFLDNREVRMLHTTLGSILGTKK